MPSELAHHWQIILNSLRSSLPRQMQREYMAKVPYALAIGGLMYVIVCMRSDIAHVVRVE